jgi:predicted transcriptional regulator
MQGTKEAIGGHVDSELAAEIRRLAEEGNRSVSREVAAALRAHVARETPLAPRTLRRAVEA